MSGFLRPVRALLRAPASELCFAVRSSLRWSRGVPGRDALAGAPTFAWAPEPIRAALEARADALEQRYQASAPIRGLAPELRARNYARLEQLDRLADGLVAPCSPAGVVRAADIGSGDFYYAAALSRWLARTNRPSLLDVALRGVEVDGYGLQRDGYSRADHGRGRAAAASGDRFRVSYEVGDARALGAAEQDVVSMFYPFLTSIDGLASGAPWSQIQPRKALEAAVSALRPGGWLVVANRSSREFVKLTRLLAGLPVTRIAKSSFATDLAPEAPHTAEHVGSIWVREGMSPQAL
ncbi:MAG: hypothetical protein VYD05_01325 [Planctomycetota bacterium]|nr:hypothetical protein [Planctomycetota bacterium]